MMKIILTDHGIKRVRKRLGIPKKCVERVVEKAFNIGITHKMCKGQLRKYINCLYLRYREANNIRIYDNNIFLFKKNILLTVIPLDQKFHKYVEIAKKDN